jgi:hypothetical protein
LVVKMPAAATTMCGRDDRQIERTGSLLDSGMHCTGAEACALP